LNIAKQKKFAHHLVKRFLALPKAEKGATVWEGYNNMITSKQTIQTKQTPIF
jgi:hypothetical protein